MRRRFCASGEFADAHDAARVAEIRDELIRILGSGPFRDSLRLTSFLTFIIEATLAGNASRIKSYTIAVEAFGRNSSFDPQVDSIVRVEAGRLRRALAHYYASAGSRDPLVIDLPLGNYVPLFRRRAGATSAGPAFAFQAVSERLAELSRQLAALAGEIEIAKTLMEEASRAP